MKFKNTLMICFLLLAIITIGAAGAADAPAADDTGDEQIAEAPVDVDSPQADDNDDLAARSEDEENNDKLAAGDEVLAVSEDADNLSVVGSDFEFKIKNKEIDNANQNSVMFTFEWPDGIMWGPNRMSLVIFNSKDTKVLSFYQDSTDEKVQIKLKDLETWGPGTYNYSATFYDLFDNPGVYVASGSFIVTADDVPVDFINITGDVINNITDLIMLAYDPFGKLYGFIYIYANGTLVYEKDLRVGNGGNGYDNLTVYAKDLNEKEIFDGKNKIEVVYKKPDGTKYTKTSMVTFVNVFRPIIRTKIESNPKTIVYNENKKLYAVLTDLNGNPIEGRKIYVQAGIIHGAVVDQDTVLKTDKNGEVAYYLGNLAPGQYTVTFEFKTDNTYKKSNKNVRVTVKKSTVKLTAAKQTFKKSEKTKKFKVTLKSKVNKIIKNTKLTLKVNKKTFTAKTNSKGVATFKITNLNKKGTFKVTAKFAGNKYYKSKSVTQKITVK